MDERFDKLLEKMDNISNSLELLVDYLSDNNKSDKKYGHYKSILIRNKVGPIVPNPSLLPVGVHILLFEKMKLILNFHD